MRKGQYLLFPLSRFFFAFQDLLNKKCVDYVVVMKLKREKSGRGQSLESREEVGNREGSRLKILQIFVVSSSHTLVYYVNGISISVHFPTSLILYRDAIVMFIDIAFILGSFAMFSQPVRWQKS